jgi:hypothetical protein
MIQLLFCRADYGVYFDGFFTPEAIKRLVSRDIQKR